MKKTKFTKEQIAYALRQAETGTRVGEICRKICNYLAAQSIFILYDLSLLIKN